MESSPQPSLDEDDQIRPYEHSDQKQYARFGDIWVLEDKPCDRPTLRRVKDAARELDLNEHRIRRATMRYGGPSALKVYRRPRALDPRRADHIRAWVDLDEVKALATAEGWPAASQDPLVPRALAKRFRILERDGFACRYCGRRPPAVVLEVDHVMPRCLGGSDDPTNLVAACEDCNAGKHKLPLKP